ncbi:transporter substrate-binding domain-containing protein [Burkholderia cenocepacia]|uniref:transporter substrate-binding domain-containing protein n=1 Tax=Burkholderia cenocepacia TaxID=95486 RepID=UPI001BAAD305|nr:transporter substrate-binding domain-containing protein [Burkholderia cenocepacia]QUN38667.1 transporter substrate-binding domain-containing protein [Burkholderia cenocepacia]
MRRFLSVRWLACIVTIAGGIQQTLAADIAPPVEPVVITVGTSLSGRMPFEQADLHGNLSGFGPDYLKALLQGTHVTIRTRVYPNHATLVKAGCNGEVDLITGLGSNPERARCLLFSAPYAQDSAAILGRKKDRRSADNAMLAHARIGVFNGSVYESELRRTYPQARIVPLDFNGVIDAVESGKIDVYFGTARVLDYALAARNVPDPRSSGTCRARKSRCISLRLSRTHG